MVRVYLWLPGFFRENNSGSSSSGGYNPTLFGHVWNWGHVAIEVPEPTNSYIPTYYWSYWPPHYKPDKYAYCWNDDRETCGRKPDNTIEINNLDEEAMQAEWEKEVLKEFHELEHNCCTVAASLLRAGLAKDFKHFLRQTWRMVRNPFLLYLNTGISVAGELSFWDPFKIESLAKYIKKIADD